MISMAHDIGYRVIAEGVETECLRFLEGCEYDEIQGYFIARPLAPEACEAFCETSYFASSVAGVSSPFRDFRQMPEKLATNDLADIEMMPTQGKQIIAFIQDDTLDFKLLWSWMIFLIYVAY